MKQNNAEAALRAVREAVLYPELWPDALEQVANACNSSMALVQMIGTNGFHASVNRSRTGLLPEYVASGWHERNPRMARGLALTRLGRSGLITEQDMMTREELARHPFQQDFATKYEIDHEAGRVVASHAGWRCILTMQRGARAGPYLGAELDAMNRLADGFSETCSFALRLKLTSAVQMMETLGEPGEAAALLSSSLRVLAMTPAFEQLVRGRLLLRRGRVHACIPAEDSELQALLIRSGARGETVLPSASVVIGRGALGALVARCLPVAGAARDFLGLARLVLTFDELAPSKPKCATDALRAAFGLTPAEARLADRISAGETLREAAAAEKVAFETMRTRLKAVFSKTGTRRQTELALLVDRLG